ncbi:MAG: DegV family protein [Oscillospiraceae bacterium]|nr:DegV family protein [Oscillospiraceae bacterium]
MKIVADTPTLFTPEEAKALGIITVPSCAIIDGTAYRDFLDISGEDFLALVNGGAVPTTSQPAIGDILEAFESTGEEILALPIGDGLSGTYSAMVSARDMAENPGRIHVVDTKTLAAAQRYLVRKALRLAEEGEPVSEIVRDLEENIESSLSFVIPADFDFLRRSGRLTPVAAKLLRTVRVVPVLTQNETKKRISLFIIKLSRQKALEAVAEHLKKVGVDENWLIGVCHAGAEEEAAKMLEYLHSQFPGAETALYPLVPSLMTHGGPGCVTIQVIRK